MYAYTQDVPIDFATYERIIETLGPAPLEGSLLHLCVRRPDGGLRYIDVWDSEEACATAFRERIHPAVDAAFGGRRPAAEPTVDHCEVLHAMGGLLDRPARAATAQSCASAAVIRNVYDAFLRGDMETVVALFDPNILWHVPGRGPLSRDYRGPQEILGFFQHFTALSDGTFGLRVDHVLAEDDKVAVLCTESARRGGRSWSSPQVHLWTVGDGRATVFRQFQGDQQTEDEFWSSDG